MGPIEEKMLMVGVDLVTDVLMDMYYRKTNEGVQTISVDEILAEAQKYQSLRASEIKKVKDRMKANEEATP